MSNFWEDITSAANGDPIEAIVIGDMGWGDYNDKGTVPQEKRGVILTPAEAEPLLSYEYSRGFGAPECHAIWAWTPSRVLFVSQYDGATGVESLPRNPVAEKPEMPGG